MQEISFCGGMFYDTSESKTKQIKELQLQSERSIFYNNLCAGQETDSVPYHRRGGACPSPTTVSDIVRVLKSLTTGECKKIVPVDKLFQRSFYDHIKRRI